MHKGVWLFGWLGLGVLMACGVQSVDYPTGTPTGDGGVSPGGACTTNAQCSNAAPVCNPATGTCGPCTQGSQCSNGLACIGGQCGACTSNDQCPVGQVCANGACGPCQVSTQCNPGLTCTNGSCGGGGDGGGVTNPDTGIPGCNAGYVGVIGPSGPVWHTSLGAAAGGAQGKQAGDNACAAIHGAGAHACTWEEVKASDVCGKLTGLKATTDSAWMHRTGTETADGTTKVVDDNPGLQPGAPSKGATCNDWLYPTNHAFDGEWIEFGGNAMKGHFDSNTAFNNDAPPHANNPAAASGVLECNGMSRKILCCK